MIDRLMSIIDSEGITLTDRDNVIKSLENAINSECFKYIYKDGVEIGFITWKYNNKELFFNNLVIYKKYKGEFKLISLRKFFRNKYKEVEGCYWRSRKKNKPVEFKEKRMNLCM